jgi:hypothetical protein
MTPFTGVLVSTAPPVRLLVRARKTFCAVALVSIAIALEIVARASRLTDGANASKGRPVTLRLAHMATIRVVVADTAEVIESFLVHLESLDHIVTAAMETHPLSIKTIGDIHWMSPRIMFLSYCSIAWSLSAPARRLTVLTIPILPLAPVVVALQVLVVATVAVVLAGLILLAATALAVLAAIPVPVADQPLLAITVAVAGIALEALRRRSHVLTECRAIQHTEASNGQRAAGGGLKHATSVSLLANDAGEMVETIGIHAFHSLSTSTCALNRTVRV